MSEKPVGQAASVLGELAGRLRAATRKEWFRTVPMFESHATCDRRQLEQVERRVGRALPADLSTWLLLLGYGDINDALSFRDAWFFVAEHGALRGAVIFAQDIHGNFYAFTQDDRIVFFARHEHAFAVMAASFCDFIQELTARNYDLRTWSDSLSLEAYPRS